MNAAEKAARYVLLVAAAAVAWAIILGSMFKEFPWL